MSTFTQFIGGRLQAQTFNSSGTFTAPAGVNNVWISMSGGGGGSGDSSGTGGIATGGGAGAWCAKIPVPVTPGANYTVTVGAGGASSISSSVYGGTSSFGNLISRVGGLSGQRYFGGSNWIGSGGGSAMGGAAIPNNATASTWYMPAGSAGGAISGQGIYAGGAGYFGNGANSGGGGDGGDTVAVGGYSGKVIVEWIA